MTTLYYYFTDTPRKREQRQQKRRLRIPPSSLRRITTMLFSFRSSCQVSPSEVKRLASVVTQADESTCNFGKTMEMFSRGLPLSILTIVPEVTTIKHAHIICYMMEFSSMFIKLCYGCEELESITKCRTLGCILSM